MEDEDGNNPKDAKGDGKRIKLEKEEEDDGREDMEFKLDEEVDQGQSEKDGTDSDDEEDMDEEEARMYDQVCTALNIIVLHILCHIPICVRCGKRTVLNKGYCTIYRYMRDMRT